MGRFLWMGISASPSRCRVRLRLLSGGRILLISCLVSVTSSQLQKGKEDTGLTLSAAVALGLPYGVLADKIGRRPVVVMSLSAIAISEIWPRIVCGYPPPLTGKHGHAKLIFRLVRLASSYSLAYWAFPSPRRRRACCYEYGLVHCSGYLRG